MVGSINAGILLLKHKITNYNIDIIYLYG